MRRATPSARAAALTALAIAGTTWASKTDGRMYSADRSAAGTLSASAAAAASSMFVVTVLARASSRPRNTPGNASTLFT